MKVKKNDVNVASRSVGFGIDAPDNLLWAGLHRFFIGRFSTTFQ